MVKRILHVEDDLDTLNLVKEILEKGGYRVVGCESGEECLESWKKEKPDLILLDMMMPSISGWDVYTKIRREDKNVKVAFLSVLDITSRRRDGIIEAGVSDYIVKPFTNSDLVKRVKKILGE